jgi:hypothetical protein
LRDRKGVNLADWNLVDQHTDKKPARTDHFFEWEQKAALDAASGQLGAHIRMQLQVQGDEVSGYRVFIKIPETWRDAEIRATPAQLAQSFGRAAGIGLAFITVLMVFSQRKSGRDPRSVARAGKLSILMLLAGMAVFVNQAPAFLNYRRPGCS